MDILIYNWKDKKNPDRGGAEIVLFRFAKALVDCGHVVTIFSRLFKNALSEEYIEGVRVVRRGNLLSTYWHGFRYYRSLKKKPDLVIDILNTLFWYTPLYVKGPILACVNQLAKEVLFFELPRVISYVAYALEKLQFLPYRYKRIPFICYAQSVKEDLIQIGIPAERISLFSLGLDHTQFYPALHSVQAGKTAQPSFLAINRLVKMKRTDLGIRAMVEVVAQFPTATLSIIGFGYDKPRLERIIKKLHLEKNVQFKVIPFFAKAEEERTRLMQSAWALLFPSVKEGWGMTVTECAACGTPSIVSNVTGLKDSVKDNETGIIVSANPTSQELAQAMIRLINDTALRARLSEQAVAWVSGFSWERSCKEFSAIVEAVKGR